MIRFFLWNLQTNDKEIEKVNEKRFAKTLSFTYHLFAKTKSLNKKKMLQNANAICKGIY